MEQKIKYEHEPELDLDVEPKFVTEEDLYFLDQHEELEPAGIYTQGCYRKKKLPPCE